MAQVDMEYGSGVPATTWKAGFDREELVQIRQERGFHSALAQAAQNLVEVYEGNRLLNRILNDRERAAFALMALYLHVTPDETGRRLTAGRIVALSRETELCSRGRAKAMLLLMRWAGYLVPDTDTEGDRRQRPLVPTESLIAMQTDRWRRLYAAMALFDPLAVTAVARLEEPAFREGLTRVLIKRFVGGMRLLDHAPALQLFVSRDGGLMMAFRLLLAGAPDDVFPPQQPVNVAVAELSRKFHVSRAHVLKLLRDAETAGLIQRMPGINGGIRLLPPLIDGLCDFMGGAFLMLRASARDLLGAEAGTAAAPPDVTAA